MAAVTERAAPARTRARLPQFTFQQAVPRTATLWSRFFAVLTDLLLVSALSWGAAITLYALGVIPGFLLGGGTTESQLSSLFILVLLLEAPLTLAYFTLLEGHTGRTVGKLAFGIRVERLDGEPLRLFDAFIRNLLRELWAAPGLGVLFILLDGYLAAHTEMEQRIGDMAAGTIVVRADADARKNK